MKLKVEHFHAYDLVSICFDQPSEILRTIYREPVQYIGSLDLFTDCDKTSEKRKRKSVVFGINVYLNKFNIKF
jgi:hypothetical protein